MRTFVAVELTQECRNHLLEAIETLQAVAGGIKWSDEKKLHVTIKFIGELKEEALPRATSALQDAAQEVQPFEMDISGLSGFPPEGVPNVLFAAVRDSTGALHTLQSAVEDVLAKELDVDREDRDFIPHVTLGRVKKKGFCPPLEKLRGQLQDTHFGAVPVDEMVLIKSELTPDGPIYTPLRHVGLEGEV